jgi:hypothetical protein
MPMMTQPVTRPDDGQRQGSSRPPRRHISGIVTFITLLLIIADTGFVFILVFTPLTDSVGGCGGG